MKFLLLFLTLPLFSVAQTVHVKDENIVYEGSETVSGISASEIFRRIQQMLPIIVGGYKVAEQSDHLIIARGELRLKTPYTIQRTVPYSIRVKAKDNGYEYRIDSVSFVEQKRGGKAVTRSSKDVVKDMGETGKIVGDTEKILNETDMRLQQILMVIKSTVNKK
jgi:hypothetical protein